MRTRGGRRRYTDDQISVIQEFKKLRSKGVSLSEIKWKLSNGDRGGNSNSNRIDLLAEKVAKVVRLEVLRLLERGVG